MTKKPAKRTAAAALSLALIASTTLVCTQSETGWAMLAPASTAETAGFDRAADMKTIQTALESKAVRGRLKTLGLSESEIEGRLARVSDQQVHQMARDIETIAPGGDVGGILVLVILVLLIVFLIHKL